jgi:heparan-alpha-glucosaminide N-acetyltransferase
MLQTPKRHLSIDVFRAINMFFMIFVNDLSGVRDIPLWIDHVKANEDGMHFADSIFPLFLFIAGLSIPLAIGRRISRGDSFYTIAFYILLRASSLIVMGFFHVNLENYSDAALLPLGIWEVLLTLSFFLIWLDYPDTLAKTKKYALIGAGFVLLIVLAVLYKGGSTDAPSGLKPSWWGILGIIGWAYLICSGIYLLVKGNLAGMAVALALFVGFNVAVHTDWVDYVWIVHDGASVSLMMFGVVTSILYLKLSANGSFKKLWLAFALSGTALIAIGFIIRPYTEGISKIHSTPAWVFICSGIGILLFEFLIWLVDVKGKQKWFNIIKPAGTSTLTCYLIPYFIVAIFSLIDFNYPHFLNFDIGGIIRSFAVSFIVIFITGFL